MADNFLTRFISKKRKESDIGGDKRTSKIDEEVVKESNETQEYRDQQTRKKEANAMKSGFRGGGYVRGADGCAVKGRTKGKFV